MAHCGGALLAAAIHLCVVSNLSRVRSDPFLYCLDEFPSLKFDRMDQWANEYRSAGGVPIVGIQSLNQLYNLYGDKKGARSPVLCQLTSSSTPAILRQPRNILSGTGKWKCW